MTSSPTLPSYLHGDEAGVGSVDVSHVFTNDHKHGFSLFFLLDFRQMGRVVISSIRGSSRTTNSNHKKGVLTYTKIVDLVIYKNGINSFPEALQPHPSNGRYVYSSTSLASNPPSSITYIYIYYIHTYITYISYTSIRPTRLFCIPTSQTPPNKPPPAAGPELQPHHPGATGRRGPTRFDRRSFRASRSTAPNNENMSGSEAVGWFVAPNVPESL